MFLLDKYVSYRYSLLNPGLLTYQDIQGIAFLFLAGNPVCFLRRGLEGEAGRQVIQRTYVRPFRFLVKNGK